MDLKTSGTLLALALAAVPSGAGIAVSSASTAHAEVALAPAAVTISLDPKPLHPMLWTNFKLKSKKLVPRRAAVGSLAREAISYAPTVHLQTPVNFLTWLHSKAARAIRDCESGVVTAVSGIYMGAWQMDENFWRSNGGLKFSATPLGATAMEQNLVAWNGYRSRGWEPRTCARILGYYP